MSTVLLEVPSIVCGGCAELLTEKIGQLPGVDDVRVDVAAKQVTVTGEVDEASVRVPARPHTEGEYAMSTTYDTGTLLTCEHEGCGCRVMIQAPCHCSGADDANYTCACGAKLVPVSS